MAGIRERARRELRGPWKLCAVVAVLALLTIASEASGLGRGGPAVTRTAIALGGLAGAIVFASGRRPGWILVLAWALIQIPFFAPAPGASPTQQSFPVLAYHEVRYSISAGPAARQSGSSVGLGLSTPVESACSLMGESGFVGSCEGAGRLIDSYSEYGLGWVGIVFSILVWRRRDHPGLVRASSAATATG
jgi:hypothetical protein